MHRAMVPVKESRLSAVFTAPPTKGMPSRKLEAVIVPARMPT